MYWVNGFIHSLIPNLRTWWSWVAIFTPWPLTQVYETSVPTQQDVGWAPEPDWMLWRR